MVSVVLMTRFASHLLVKEQAVLAQKEILLPIPPFSAEFATCIFGSDDRKTMTIIPLPLFSSPPSAAPHPQPTQQRLFSVTRRRQLLFQSVKVEVSTQLTQVGALLTLYSSWK